MFICLGIFSLSLISTKVWVACNYRETTGNSQSGKSLAIWKRCLNGISGQVFDLAIGTHSQFGKLIKSLLMPVCRQHYRAIWKYEALSGNNINQDNGTSWTLSGYREPAAYKPPSPPLLPLLFLSSSRLLFLSSSLRLFLSSSLAFPPVVLLLATTKATTTAATATAATAIVVVFVIDTLS